MERVKEVVTGGESEDEEHVARLPALLPGLVQLGRRLMPSELGPHAGVDAPGGDQPTMEAVRGLVGRGAPSMG